MIRKNIMKKNAALIAFWLGVLAVAPLSAHRPQYIPVAELIGTVPGSGDGTTNGFGSTCRLNGDWAFVSSPLANPTVGQIAAGVVYAYHKDAHGNWDTAHPQLIELTGPSHHLGLSQIESQGKWLFLSCTGTPIHAAPGVTVGDFKGAVVIYKLKKGVWTFVQSLDSTTVSELANLVPISPEALNVQNSPYAYEQGASFGLTFSVDVAKGVMIVGAENQTDDPVNSVNQGRAYAFKLVNGKWKYQQTLSNPDGISANDGFGAQVAVKGDLALISNAVIFQGPRVGNATVYVYRYEQNRWHLVQKVHGQQASSDSVPVTFVVTNPLLTANVGDTFGSALALDRNWAVIGAAFEDEGKGAVYFYKVNPSRSQPLTFAQRFYANDPNPFAQQFALTNVAISGDIAIVSNITATGPTPNSTPFLGGANVYVLDHHDVWSYETTLFDPQGTNMGLFGAGVDVEDNTLIVGAGAQGIVAEIIGAPPLLFTGQPIPSLPELRQAVIYKRKVA